MYYPEDLVERIQESNDIVDVISSYVSLNKKGNTYWGLCPFHNEKSPSFSVSQDKQLYHCFGCSKGGNVYTFVRDYENYSFVEAIQYLAERASIELPVQKMSNEEKQKQDLKTTLFSLYKQAATYYCHNLYSESGKVAREYFVRRGISEEMIRSFGLGYANQYSRNLYNHLLSLGFDQNVLMESKLFHFDEKTGVTDRFWNRIMFPILDVNNKVIGFGGRVLGEGKPKYLNSPEFLLFDKSRNLYGLSIARKTKLPYFLICEGYTDVIALHQAGFTNAVATLGTAITEGHVSLIKRYVKQVYLVYDNDTAGVKATERALLMFRSVGLQTKVVDLSPFKDPDEFIKNRSIEEFQERILQATNGFLFSIKELEKTFDLQSPEERTFFFKEVAKRLLVFDDELERTVYEEAIVDLYKLDVKQLHQLVVKTAVAAGHAKLYSKTKQYTTEEKKQRSKSIQAQKVLLAAFATDTALYAKLKAIVTPKDFTTGLYQDVAEVLYKQLDEGKVNLARMVSLFESEEDQQEVSSIFYETEVDFTNVDQTTKSWKDVVIQIKTASLTKLKEDMELTDATGFQRYIEEKKKLDELKRQHLLHI